MAQIRDISKRTALYERLSKDDEQQGESNSILNQKQYLEEYAHKNGFVNIQHFTDDGYTGRNFNRPGFQEMLAEIENGKIGTVIVKDMSRFGRNYLQVGFYTEMMFPQKQVRFIAINNSVDGSYAQAAASALVALLLCPFAAPMLLSLAGSALIVTAAALFAWLF